MTKLSLLIAISVVGCATDERPPVETSEEQGLLRNAGTLYSDGNGLGSSLGVAANSLGTWTDANLPASFDNIASSLSVQPPCTIELWTGPDQTGTSIEYTAYVNLFPIGIDNAVSSYRAACVPRCATGKRYCGPDVGCVVGLCQ